MTIPKRIFYVWGANEPKKKEVLICMSTWYNFLKDYEIIEINENSTEYFDFQKELKENFWFRTVYERKMWAYVADYIRLKVLYDNGGIYFDTDVTVFKSLNDLLNEPAFVSPQDINRVEPAILGSKKGNKLLRQILDFYQNDGEIYISDLYKIPDVFKYFLNSNHGLQEYDLSNNAETIYYNDITILPKRFLIPFNGAELYHPDRIFKDTYTSHWYNGSWVKPEILFFLENKNKMPLGKIDKAYKCMLLKEKIQKLFSVKNEYKDGYKRKIIWVLGARISVKVKAMKPLSKKQINGFISYQKNNSELIVLNGDSNSKEKILHYSTYKIHCGIAQFCEDYIEGLNKAGYTNNAVLPVNYEYLKSKELIFNYLNKLIEYSRPFDTVVIQHEYGFWKIEDFIFENRNIDSQLFKCSIIEKNKHTYGLLLLDYLVENLLKQNKKITIIWHTDFEYLFRFIQKPFNYRNIPFFRLIDNKLLKIVVMNSKMLDTFEKRSIPTENVIFMIHPVKTNAQKEELQNV